MARVYLSIGGNQGDREKNLAEVCKHISSRIGIIRKQSAIYESEPWGFECNSNFLNQVVMVESGLTPAALMLEISYIESLMGRERKNAGYSSRTMDIDVLFYEQAILLTPELIVPHKHLHKRRFVLEPLNEIAPNLIHPLFSLTVHDLLVTCTDKSKAWKYEPVTA
ncbi:MAG: 2-amino-4-hydroxy-6-hydroxymethyldihydropteridine diphosphokinase [Bacteroidales bacterium]|nr:2-amino-4-hydroxy-6-hydroxymethyldihydropteridine diphosphokinase [Bacteroidales bacterium]